MTAKKKTENAVEKKDVKKDAKKTAVKPVEKKTNTKAENIVVVPVDPTVPVGAKFHFEGFKTIYFCKELTDKKTGTSCEKCCFKPSGFECMNIRCHVGRKDGKVVYFEKSKK